MSEASRGEGTVGKALDVLDQVAAFGRPVRFTELLTESVFPKATLYRLLQTLVRQGMVHHDPAYGTYSIGVRLVRLAHEAWRQASLAPIARPYIDALSADLGETVHLAQLDNAQVLYVDKRNAGDPVEMYSQAGKVGPVYCTGIGKAMLAYLPPSQQDDVIAQQSYHRFTAKTLTSPAALRAELGEIRARGYSFDREEHEPGIICVAVPILSSAGSVLGGVSVTSTTSRHSLDDMAKLAPRLDKLAAQIAFDAEAWRFPDEHKDSA